jgi:hypothetical protein
MGLMCKIFGHSLAECKCRRCGEFIHRWDGCKCSNCRKVNHKWDGCKCSACGDTRSMDHQWNDCKCSVCGETRLSDPGFDFVRHTLQGGCECVICGNKIVSAPPENHRWDGCICSVCRTTREAEHRWVNCKCTLCGARRDSDHDLKGCQCQVCGLKTQSAPPDSHSWDGCKCIVCGATRDVGHRWSAWNECERCKKVNNVEVRCAICGNIAPVDAMRGYGCREPPNSVLWFCMTGCWGRRGSILFKGTQDCPEFRDGMCGAGRGDNLCNWPNRPYCDCSVYGLRLG